VTTAAVNADARAEELLRRCDRTLIGHPPRTPTQWLALLAEHAEGTNLDKYGAGELIEDVERRVAELLGTEAAVFMPSGTMAQQTALRTWADQTGVRTVALHPQSHLERHELRAIWELHGLRPLHLTHERRQPTAADLAQISEPIGTVHVELPLRDLGYQLPGIDELRELCAAARDRDAAVHFDGARIWESVPHLGPLPEIAALADSVYVSFYKSLGAIAGAALGGSQLLVDSARRWQQRHGGRIITQFPALLAARHSLEVTLPRVPAYVAHARQLAAALAVARTARVFPEPPHVNGFHIYLEAPADKLIAAAMDIAEERRVWTTRWWTPTDVPGWSSTEIAVGEATMGWSPQEFADVIAELLDRAKT
jgi:threonine aldolase